MIARLKLPLIAVTAVVAALATAGVLAFLPGSGNSGDTSTALAFLADIPKQLEVNEG